MNKVIKGVDDINEWYVYDDKIVYGSLKEIPIDKISKIEHSVLRTADYAMFNVVVDGKTQCLKYAFNRLDGTSSNEVAEMDEVEEYIMAHSTAFMEREKKNKQKKKISVVLLVVSILAFLLAIFISKGLLGAVGIIGGIVGFFGMATNSKDVSRKQSAAKNPKENWNLHGAKALTPADLANMSSSTTAPKEKDASVVGRAIVGGAVAGPVGAVVGAISAVDKNNRNSKKE